LSFQFVDIGLEIPILLL